ncbi:MAG: cation diffusion facilitator family transporter [Myxococcota bacterium]
MGAPRSPLGLVHAARLRAGGLALGVGFLVFLGKLAVYTATGSTAVLSDALESVVNVVAAALLLYSLIVAARPADRDHPYGHGKVEFFSSGVEGALIAVAALLILVEAGRALLLGPEVRNLDTGVVALAGITLVNGALGMVLIRTGRRAHSVALVADGQHVLTDVWTSVGVLAGLLAVRLTGWTPLDPLMAIAVAINILRMGWKLVRAAIGGLMDEADQDLLSRVASILEVRREPWWIDVHGLRTFGSGALRHTDLHLAVPRFFDAERLHAIHDEVRRVVNEATGMPGDVIVHFDPCRPRQCPSCTLSECPVRAGPFVARAPITWEAAVRGDEQLDSGDPIPGEEA